MELFLERRPLFLLFAVLAFGYLLGQIRVLGFSLGVAAVLFGGVLAGWAVPRADLPDFIPQLGLVLFVYTVGLASGPGFFASMRARGLRDNALALFVLLCSWLVTLALGRAFGLDGAILSGLFAGALNNAPALAAVAETLRSAGATGAALTSPVVAFSVCYPLGVLIPLLVVAMSERAFRVSFANEPISRAYQAQGEGGLVNVTAVVHRAPEGSAHELRNGADYAVVFSRFRRGDVTDVVHEETRFEPGDLVTVIGREGDVEKAVARLGHASEDHLELDRSSITYRRMFVSNKSVTERPLRELHLTQKFDAIISRVRRGDVDLTPNDDFELMLGDRARVVAPQSRLHEIEHLLGDSAKHVAEVDVLTFALGIALGLLLGAIAIPLPGGVSFSLGSAGGPLVVGLVLGKIGRTGPLVWTSPYGENVTLRQLGVVLFLAGAGIRSGTALGGGSIGHTLLLVVVVGATISALVSLSATYFGHRMLGIPLGVTVGALAGIQTQPAVLAYAVEKSERELPNIGYATVFPLAMIAKILLAQVLLQLQGWR